LRRPAATLALLAGLLAACAGSRGPTPVPDRFALFPGARVSLALPPGFHPDPALPGFASEDERTALFASEVPGSVYATLRSFSGEAFQKNGMLLLDQERVTVDGWPGRIFRASQPTTRGVELARWVVVFGDDSVSVVLTAVTPRETWPGLAGPLRAALLSARWHRDGVEPAIAPAGSS